VAGTPGDPVSQRAQARVGWVLRSKWRLDALLGVGGMAAVYAATHRNGKRGAVKMLHLELSTNEEARRRFLREGYVANAVDHPGAVSVLDDDIAEDGSVFLVMELLEGQSVEAWASSHPGSKLSPGEVLGITEQLLDTLAIAHQKGIVHRDLKPENLFLTSAGQVKVLDFGLARLHDLRGSGAPRMTTAGAAMGTPAFMPPEQALGNWDQVDARTDLWAVGASMFTLLTGRIVHEAENVNKLLLAAMTKPARPVASVDPTVPAAVAKIVDRALAFERDQRWPDAATMRDAVRGARALAHSAMAVGAPASVGPVSGVGSTRLVVGAAQTHDSISLGGTTSEPRLRVATRGVLAGVVLVVLTLGGVVLVVVRGQHSPASGAASGPVTTSAPPHNAPEPPATEAPTVSPEPPVVSAAVATPTPNVEPSQASQAGASSAPFPPSSRPKPAPLGKPSPKGAASSKNPWDKW
jgi:eukaryotic-like serine/threonine-protein kinase